MKTRRRGTRKTKTTEKRETDPGVQEGNENAQTVSQQYSRLGRRMHGREKSLKFEVTQGEYFQQASLTYC